MKLFNKRIKCLNNKNILKIETCSKIDIYWTFGISRVGKNHLTYLMRNALFSRGEATQYFHHISSGLFAHKDEIDRLTKDKETMRDQIRKAVQKCDHAMIVLDDAHILHPELLNSKAPFLNTLEKVENVNYPNMLFILISNTGTFELIDVAQNAYYKVRTVWFTHNFWQFMCSLSNVTKAPYTYVNILVAINYI